jgi:hypothetical protein
MRFPFSCKENENYQQYAYGNSWDSRDGTGL